MNQLEIELNAILKTDEIYFPFQKFTGLAGASVLVLFHGQRFESSEILLIKRSLTVASHRGQVAFPGGGVEPEDEGDQFKTAIRETYEEVGVEPAGIRSLGVLPVIPTVSGGFFVSPVVGVAGPQAREQDLVLDLNEVAFAEWVLVSDLLQTRTHEVREVRGQLLSLPVFQWKDEKMWGMTALIFDLILSRYGTLKA
jgi:8-oxo-dGTP pyrophosphatase MutT (NUDIX family)